MPNVVTDLIIDRLDLVDEGANTAAFISLYKRKEQVTMDLKEILEKMAPEQASVIQGKLDELSGNLTTATADLTKAKQDLAKAEEDLAKAAQKTTETTEDVLKAMPEAAREVFTKMKLQLETAEEALRKSKEAEDLAKAKSKAAELKSLPVEQDALVEVLKSCPDNVVGMLATIAAAIDNTTLSEVGKSKAGRVQTGTSGNDAWGKIEAKAAELAKSKNISVAKAVALAVEENPALYEEYLKEGAN